MSVIIFILKLLGILLLAVIGILLLLLILLLFYPIGYRIEGVSEEKIKVGGSFYWLFHIVSFRLEYAEDGISTCLKICGFQIGKKKKEDIEETDFNETPDASAVLSAMSIENEKDTDAPAEEQEASVLQERKSPKKKKRGFHFWQKREELLRKWREFWQRFKKTAQNIKQKAEVLKEQLTDRTNQMAVSYIWKELVYLLKHLRFRRLKTEIEFSLKDPAATGQALGVLSIFPVLYRYDVHIYPDFLSERVYVKGSFRGRGHFRLLHLLISIGRLLLKKECRILLKRVLNK